MHKQKSIKTKNDELYASIYHKAFLSEQHALMKLSSADCPVGGALVLVTTSGRCPSVHVVTGFSQALKLYLCVKYLMKILFHSVSNILREFWTKEDRWAALQQTCGVLWVLIKLSTSSLAAFKDEVWRISKSTVLLGWFWSHKHKWKWLHY